MVTGGGIAFSNIARKHERKLRKSGGIEVQDGQFSFAGTKYALMKKSARRELSLEEMKLQNTRS